MAFITYNSQSRSPGDERGHFLPAIHGVLEDKREQRLPGRRVTSGEAREHPGFFLENGVF
jgi:hypothetical protein